MTASEKPVTVSDELRALDPALRLPGAEAVTDQAPPAPGASPVGALSPEDAARLARLGVDWILAAVVKQYPVLSYPEETRARAAQLAGAVLAKYDVLSWLVKWRAEFELGAFLAGVAWESYKVVQRSKQPAPAAEGEVKPSVS